MSSKRRLPPVCSGTPEREAKRLALESYGSADRPVFDTVRVKTERDATAPIAPVECAVSAATPRPDPRSLESPIRAADNACAPQQCTAKLPGAEHVVPRSPEPAAGEGDADFSFDALARFSTSHPHFQAAVGVIGTSYVAGDRNTRLSHAAWIDERLHRRDVTAQKRCEIDAALNRHLSRRLAAWLRDGIPHETLLRATCAAVLAGEVEASAANAGGVRSAPLCPNTNADLAVPGEEFADVCSPWPARPHLPLARQKTPPEALTALSPKGLQSVKEAPVLPPDMPPAVSAGFPLERFQGLKKPKSRRSLAREHFPDARALFVYHLSRALSSHEEPDPDERAEKTWTSLSSTRRAPWEDLLAEFHLSGARDLCQPRATVLLSHLGVTVDEPPLGPVTPARSSSSYATPSAQDLAIHAPSRPRPSPAPAPTVDGPSQYFLRPTLCVLARWYNVPQTCTVMLPIGTPDCPIDDATQAEVEAACHAAFGTHEPPPQVQRLNAHVWLARPWCGRYDAYDRFFGVRVSLRGHVFHTQRMLRQSRVFEADLSAAGPVPAADVARLLRGAFRVAPEMREDVGPRPLDGRGRKRRLVLSFPTPVHLLRVYVPVRHTAAFDAGAHPFVACFTAAIVPTDRSYCWICEIRHLPGMCNCSSVVPWPA